MSIDWQRELEQLREQGEQLQQKVEATQREIFELLELPEVGTVVIEKDEQGLIADITIDSSWRDSLSPAEFEQEVNVALLRSSGLLTAAPGDQPPSGSPQAGHGQSYLERVMASFNSPAAREPEEISNDFNTLTVTAMLGNVSSISADKRWIAQTPDHLIAEEIVRIARIAALQTDVFGRFTS